MFSVRLARWILRYFRASGVLCGILAACVFPASAQNFSQVRFVNLPAPAPFFARFVPAIASGGFQTRATSAVEHSMTPQYRVNLFDAPRDSTDCWRGLEEMVEFSGTPFIQQVRMPLGSLFGGRINLGGFNTVTPTESIQRGLAGGGSLGAWSGAPMGRAGMILPKDDNQYGLSLTFYYAGNVENARNAKLNGIVIWLAEKNPVTWLAGSYPR